jgi:tripartite-type tricarboxylate transporter receptor subunit TctC
MRKIEAGRHSMVAAFALLSGVLLACAALQAFAQPYPSRPVKIVVPFAAGGGVDSLSRIVAQYLSPRLKQTVVVDNKPGANANLGAEIVAKAAPDGYTLLMTSSVSAVNRAMSSKLSYDALTDFVQIARVARGASIMVCSPALPIHSVADLIAYARANPGKVTYASTGVGSGQHLNGELFAKSAAIQAVHVPYKGGALAMPDVSSGRITYMVAVPSEVLPLIAGGKLRALAVAGDKRAKALPDVPTLTQAGAANSGFTSWWGLVAPAKTPTEIVNRLADETLALLKVPEVNTALEKTGVEAAPMTPAEFASFYRDEVNRYISVVKELKIETE